MAYRSQIEKALDELISEEAGMKFQGLAVVLAKQKWRRLVACERKWDLGLDAHASGELEPDGRGMGLACSLTGEYDKIASDAVKVKKNYLDVKILVFATAEKVTKHTEKHWQEEIRREFDLELIVVSRKDLVTWLLGPANAAICSVQLGIPVEVKSEVEPVLERAREATAEVVASWEQRPRLRRIILEAPAGRGKTTTLVQLAKRTMDAGGLAFLVDLPAWVKSGTEILQFVAERPRFASCGLNVSTLSSLGGNERFVYKNG